MTVIWAEVLPIDRLTGLARTLRITSHNDRRITSAGGVVWRPAVTRRPGLTLDLFDGAFSGQISSGAGEMELSLSALGDLPPLAWGRRACRIWAGEPGDDPTGLDPWFVGLVDSATLRDGRLILRLTVDDAWMDRPILPDDYAGTGGAEGGADLRGIAKPLSIGAPRGVEPVAVDIARSIFQYDAYGMTGGVAAAFERAVAFPAPAATFGSYDSLAQALDSGDIPPGFYAVVPAQGFIGFGAPPSGVLTLDVVPRVDLRTPGEVMAALAGLAGASDRVDLPSLAALDAGLAALDPQASIAVSLYQRDKIPARQLLQEIAQSCNAAAGVDWRGKFIAPRIIGDLSPDLILRSDGRARPAVLDIEELDVGPPFWRLQMGAERNWRVHSFDEVAFATPLVDRGDFNMGETYREGNIIRAGDGARYLYISPTPTAGNAPPDVAFWAVFEAAPASTGTIGAPPGTPVGSTPAEDVEAQASTAFISLAIDNPDFRLGQRGWDGATVTTGDVANSLSAAAHITITDPGETHNSRISPCSRAIGPFWSAGQIKPIF
ncbi:hypothetical protein JCM17846_18540 [Iodidimonas nitroreducens]|uniref:Uncharacterized protein n=1 Tax=Iodidimonas nitroreducens TaxID=1236968 RepID=A0A5A7N778_9PROT|nr:hypothetical protein [Iodidimonas nitroreducens]GER04172.1 hypothetical protein JCM17846_18540 [Iodidimonas nitroreducens]